MSSPAIAIEHLSKRFERPLPWLRTLLKRAGPNEVQALDDVSFEVAPGEVFGLVGRNGQGKTTLIKSTCGLIEPSSGRVRVFGHDSVRDARAVKQRVGLVSADERSFYFRLSGRENLRFFARLHGLDTRAATTRIQQLSQDFELGALLDRPFQEYSTGNKQRLAIVRALLADAPLLLLDEPTRSLDPISAQGLRNVLRSFSLEAPDKTVLITTHNLAEIEQLCTRVAILSRGRLIECATLAELRRKYGAEEVVTVRIRGLLSVAQRAALPEALALTLTEHGDETRITLRRQYDDDRLHALLSACTSSGALVLGCDSEHFGLMQVLERIEARQAAP